MAVMDEFREERETIKQASFGKKIQYVFEYYKWHIVLGVAVLAAIIAIIVYFVTKKTPVLNVTFVNCTKTNQVVYFLEKAETQMEIDRKKECIAIDTSISFDTKQETVEETATMVKAVRGGQVDLFAGDYDAFMMMAYADCFVDLSSVLPAEKMEEYENYLVYADRAIIRERMENGNMIGYSNKSAEAMEEPIPVGINLYFLKGTKDVFTFYGDKRRIIGVTSEPDEAKAKNIEIFLDTLDYFVPTGDVFSTN